MLPFLDVAALLLMHAKSMMHFKPLKKKTESYKLVYFAITFQNLKKCIFHFFVFVS